MTAYFCTDILMMINDECVFVYTNNNNIINHMFLDKWYSLRPFTHYQLLKCIINF